MKILKKVALVVFLAIGFLVSTQVFATGGEDEGEGEGGEPVFTITYDFNGGATFEEKSTYTGHSVAVAPELSYENLVSCFEYVSDLDECHPLDVRKGKELDHVTVNGEEHYLAPGDSYMLNSDTTIVYYWNDLEMKDYTVTDESGNSITFEEAKGRTFNLDVKAFSFSMTDEELAALDPPVTREYYETAKGIISDALKDQGPVLVYFEIEVYEIPTCGEEGQPCMCVTEEGEVPCHSDVHEGPFEIKIKYTDDMAGFEAYKLVFAEMDEEGNVAVGDVVELTLVDGYLVGTIPHLSSYALIGTDNPNAPDTGVSKAITNAVAGFPFLALLGVTAFVGFIFFLKKPTIKQ